MAIGLTARQLEVAAFVRQFTRHMGHAPTVVEVQLQFGYRSRASIYRMLDRLHERGFRAVGGDFRAEGFSQAGRT